MLTANFFKTFYNDLISFIVDFKNIIIKIFSNIHNYLNKFMSDDVLIVFSIAVGAFILILIFRAIINKR